MTQYIDKSALAAEIERLKKRFIDFHHRDGMDWPLDNYGKMRAYNEVLSFLNTLEVKEINNWHLQEKEDIYDAIKDWGLYKFACIMKDGTIQKFNGSLDEDSEGHIHVHIDGVNDDYDNVDDIVKWIEYT